MRLPFTSEQFLEVFERYNAAVWPAQLILGAAGVLIAILALRASLRHSWRAARFALLLLAMLWLWSGIVYHKTYFARLSEAGLIFGSLFVAQGVLLLLAMWQERSVMDATSRGQRLAGSLLLLYALAMYPVAGSIAGHHFPAAPSFGAPCPVTIFTFGIFCLLAPAIPRFLFVIPIVWSLLASWGAIGFGMREDWMLLPSALLAMLVVHRAVHHHDASLRPRAAV